MKYLELQSVQFEKQKVRIKEKEKNVRACHRILHGMDSSYNKSVTEMTGWVDYPVCCNDDFFSEIEALAKKIQQESTALVVIGIGGSFLGARSGMKWLRNEIDGKGVEIYYAGWNLSGSYHARLLERLAEKEISLCVVSKSGKTLETAFGFGLLKEFMQKKYGEAANDRIYAITDADSGDLRREVQEQGYHALAIEKSIGGRYSVLTAVGLLPMAAGGADIRRLMAGAALAYEDLNEEELTKNPAYLYAVTRNLLYEDGKTLEFLSTMEPHMESFTEWMKQLFGESEGKNQRGVYPTCIKYSTDLHSIGQYIQDGTPNFMESVFSVAEIQDNPDFRFDGKTFAEINEITCQAVVAVRESSNIPLFHFRFRDFSEEALGYAYYFFEKACAMSCLLQGINPFDQPGVEKYKSKIKLLLKKDS